MSCARGTQLQTLQSAGGGVQSPQEQDSKDRPQTVHLDDSIADEGVDEPVAAPTGQLKAQHPHYGHGATDWRRVSNGSGYSLVRGDTGDSRRQLAATPGNATTAVWADDRSGISSAPQDFGLPLTYHTLATNNLAALLQDPVGAVCVHCLGKPQISVSMETTDETTAICSNCGVDALVPQASVQDPSTLQAWHNEGFSTGTLEPGTAGVVQGVMSWVLRWMPKEISVCCLVMRHRTPLLQKRHMCEGCGLMRPNYGWVSEGLRRWCAGCGKAEGAVHLPMSPRCGGCGLRHLSYGLVPKGKRRGYLGLWERENEEEHPQQGQLCLNASPTSRRQAACQALLLPTNGNGANITPNFAGLDEHWFKFEALCGSTYQIGTVTDYECHTPFSPLSYMDIFDSGFSSILASSGTDERNSGSNSKSITWACPSDGTFMIRLTDPSDDTGPYGMRVIKETPLRLQVCGPGARTCRVQLLASDLVATLYDFVDRLLEQPKIGSRPPDLKFGPNKVGIWITFKSQPLRRHLRLWEYQLRDLDEVAVHLRLPGGVGVKAGVKSPGWLQGADSNSNGPLTVGGDAMDCQPSSSPGPRYTALVGENEGPLPGAVPPLWYADRASFSRMASPYRKEQGRQTRLSAMGLLTVQVAPLGSTRIAVPPLGVAEGLYRAREVNLPLVGEELKSPRAETGKFLPDAAQHHETRKHRPKQTENLIRKCTVRTALEKPCKRCLNNVPQTQPQSLNLNPPGMSNTLVGGGNAQGNKGLGTERSDENIEPQPKWADAGSVSRAQEEGKQPAGYLRPTTTPDILRIFVKTPFASVTLRVSRLTRVSTLIAFLSQGMGLPDQRLWLSFGSHALHQHKSLWEYGVRDLDSITANPCLLGGVLTPPKPLMVPDQAAGSAYAITPVPATPPPPGTAIGDHGEPHGTGIPNTHKDPANEGEGSVAESPFRPLLLLGDEIQPVFFLLQGHLLTLNTSILRSVQSTIDLVPALWRTTHPTWAQRPTIAYTLMHDGVALPPEMAWEDLGIPLRTHLTLVPTSILGSHPGPGPRWHKQNDSPGGPEEPQASHLLWAPGRPALSSDPHATTYRTMWCSTCGEALTSSRVTPRVERTSVSCHLEASPGCKAFSFLSLEAVFDHGHYAPSAGREGMPVWVTDPDWNGSRPRPGVENQEILALGLEVEESPGNIRFVTSCSPATKVWHFSCPGCPMNGDADKEQPRDSASLWEHPARAAPGGSVFDRQPSPQLNVASPLFDSFDNPAVGEDQAQGSWPSLLARAHSVGREALRLSEMDLAGRLHRQKGLLTHSNTCKPKPNHQSAGCSHKCAVFMAEAYERGECTAHPPAFNEWTSSLRFSAACLYAGVEFGVWRSQQPRGSLRTASIDEQFALFTLQLRGEQDTSPYAGVSSVPQQGIKRSGGGVTTSPTQLSTTHRLRAANASANASATLNFLARNAPRTNRGTIRRCTEPAEPGDPPGDRPDTSCTVSLARQEDSETAKRLFAGLALSLPLQGRSDHMLSVPPGPLAPEAMASRFYGVAPNSSIPDNSTNPRREEILALIARVEYLQCLATSLGPRPPLTSTQCDTEMQETLDQLHTASETLHRIKEGPFINPSEGQRADCTSPVDDSGNDSPPPTASPAVGAPIPFPGLIDKPLASWLSGTQGHLLEKQLPDSFRVAALNCRSLFGSQGYALGARSFGSAIGEYMVNIDADILCVSDLAMATGRMKSALIGLGEHGVHGYFRGMGRGKGVGIFILRRLQSCRILGPPMEHGDRALCIRFRMPHGRVWNIISIYGLPSISTKALRREAAELEAWLEAQIHRAAENSEPLVVAGDLNSVLDVNSDTISPVHLKGRVQDENGLVNRLVDFGLIDSYRHAGHQGAATSFVDKARGYGMCAARID